MMENHLPGKTASSTDAPHSLVLEYKWDLAAIVQASDDAIIGTDLDANVLSWNLGAERMFGYTEGEMLGHSSAIIIPPERLGAFAERLIRIRLGEQITNFETERICKDGSVIEVSISVFPIRDASGNPVGFAGIARDISNLKRVAESARHSEERYRAIVEDQTEMICRSLPDSTLTFVNESYARYFGQPAEELVGVKFLDYLPEEDAVMMRKFLDAITPDDPVATAEHRVIRSDGEQRWHQWTDRAIYDDTGNLVEFQSVGRDITERKRAEEALQRSEELNRAVLGSLRDQIAVLDRKGSIIAVNEGWVRFAEENGGSDVGVGVNYLEVCRKAVSAQYPDAAKSLLGIESVMDSEADRYREEYCCPMPADDRWFLLSGDAVAFAGRWCRRFAYRHNRA